MWLALAILLVILVIGYVAFKSGTAALCKVPVIGGIVCPGDDGLPSCKGSADRDSCCGNVITQCTARCKADTNPNACLFKCAQQRDCDDHLSCADFGSFSTGLSNATPCGSDAEGGATCADACCKAQAAYCNGAAAGNAQKIQCMKDRNCDPSKYLSCSDFGTFAVAPGDSANWCGTDTQGGSACRDTCCAAQKKYCDPVAGNAQKVQCMKERGCSAEDLSCSDFGNFAIAPNDSANWCGTETQGGAHCKDACCAAQKQYCGNNATCMAQRGCGGSGESFLARVGHFVAAAVGRN